MASKVMIVEDEGDIRNLYSIILRSGGYEVIEAVDGQDALDKFTETPCDMVITDMNMPRMNGLELIKELRRRNQNIYIILITGYGTSETEKRAFSLGSNEYIPKPFEVEYLRDRVDDFFT
jgi:two-component system chemotaxis response regulator CheY